MKRVYVVVGLDIDDRNGEITSEEIDDILNEMDYSFTFDHEIIVDYEIVENQYPYQR